MSGNNIWICWEKHRRSKELSRHFDAELYELTTKKTGLIRYFLLTIRTFFIMVKVRPKILWVQNPSLVLTVFACLFKKFFSYRLIVDRHTNFKFHTADSEQLIWKIFHCLSDYTLRHADLTIVTNDPLKDIVVSRQGYSVALPDKLPSFSLSSFELNFSEAYSVLFVCTYSDDEHVDEVLAAARLLKDKARVYITGKVPQRFESDYAKGHLPGNVTLLGYVDDESYERYIASVDMTLILTTREYILNCGAYESLAAGTPMLLSNTKTIKDYFTFGAVYIEPSASQSIADGVEYCAANAKSLREDITHGKKQLRRGWGQASEQVKAIYERWG